MSQRNLAKEHLGIRFLLIQDILIFSTTSEPSLVKEKSWLKLTQERRQSLKQVKMVSLLNKVSKLSWNNPTLLCFSLTLLVSQMSLFRTLNSDQVGKLNLDYKWANLNLISNQLKLICGGIKTKSLRKCILSLSKKQSKTMHNFTQISTNGN